MRMVWPFMHRLGRVFGPKIYAITPPYADVWRGLWGLEYCTARAIGAQFFSISWL
ncbi:hypothetical protein [Roseobacter sp.]|uniref:hypothetical protein n=1 Tax=Roseobacter sp. TaxID=1907202 RepID=UPI00329A3CE3